MSPVDAALPFGFAAVFVLEVFFFTPNAASGASFPCRSQSSPAARVRRPACPTLLSTPRGGNRHPISTQQPPEQLDAALIFAPVGSLIVEALRATAKGGTVVGGGIHMSDIPAFPYRLLWEERAIRSVANLTRQDGEEFLAIAPKVPVKTEVVPYPLESANQALSDLRNGKLQGAAVLVLD